MSKQLILALSFCLAGTSLNAMEQANIRYCQTPKCGWAFELEESSVIGTAIWMLGKTLWGNAGRFADKVVECPKCKQDINLTFARYYTAPIDSNEDLIKRLEESVKNSSERAEIDNATRPFGKESHFSNLK